VYERRAGGRRDSIDPSSPDLRASSLVFQPANASTNVETLDSVVSEREMFRQEALNNERQRATAQDTLGNVLLSNAETNARHQEEVRQIEARYEESNKQKCI